MKSGAILPPKEIYFRTDEVLYLYTEDSFCYFKFAGLLGGIMRSGWLFTRFHDMK